MDVESFFIKIGKKYLIYIKEFVCYYGIYINLLIIFKTFNYYNLLLL